MINRTDLIPVATVNKTHGIHGELSVTIDPDVELEEGSCVIMDVDGIFVPFFITGIRPRHADTFLVKVDGVESDSAAAEFVGQTLFMLTEAFREASAGDDGEEEEEDEDGFFASALIGFTLIDTDGSLIGRIEDIDMSTPNTLLIVEREDGSQVMVPLADDLVKSFDPETREIIMDVPQGLFEL